MFGNMKRRVLVNKKTGQYSITLPKKGLPFLKEKPPKFVNLPLKERDFEW